MFEDCKSVGEAVSSVWHYSDKESHLNFPASSSDGKSLLDIASCDMDKKKDSKKGIGMP